MTDVSIIIVNYNTLKMTSECIDSVIEKTGGISYEIILVDNASSDGSKDFFSNDCRVKYIYNDENHGFGRANNKGLEIAQGRNVLFLNSDTLLKNNAIKILSDYLDNNEKVGACGGNLYNREGQPEFSFGRYFPSLYEELNFISNGKLDRLRFGENINFNHTTKPLEVAFVSGADLMVKKAVLNVTGWFDKKFFLYYEDTELCFRINKRKFKLVSVPDAQITHFWGETTGHLNEKNFCRTEQSRRIFYQLSYSRFYSSIVEVIRSVHLYRKLLSPFPNTRKRWKRRKEMLNKINTGGNEE